jgi:hypothetical protein
VCHLVPVFSLTVLMCVRYSVEIARWVSMNFRPFNIVSDPGFQCLMKMGWPDYYIPSPSTVSRDVRLVFARTRTRIATMLQVWQVLCLMSKKLSTITGIRRTTQLCNRRLDVTEPPSVCGRDRSSGTGWKTPYHAVGRCGGRKGERTYLVRRLAS